MEVIAHLVQREKSNTCFLTVRTLVNLIQAISVFQIAASIIEPILKDDEMKEYLQKQVAPTLIKGLTELSKEKPEDPLVNEYLYNNIA